MNDDAPCQLCGNERACLVLYILWFDLIWHEAIVKDFRINPNGSISIKGAKEHVVGGHANIMNLNTGKVMRKSYKKKFPPWTQDILQRAVAVSGGEFPKSIKPSKRKA